MNNDNDVTSNDPPDDSNPVPVPPESGYGSPTPEDEMPASDTSDPGSADPTLRGQQTDAQALAADPSLRVPDKTFLQDEDAGSDGEPGAGAMGGTDDQYHAEMDTPDAAPAHGDPAEEYPLEAPSTDAPLNESNAGPTRPNRESFSSQPDDDDTSGT